jgi:hypothetical protein
MASSGVLHRVALVRTNLPEDAILHSRRRENLKSYLIYVVLIHTTQPGNNSVASSPRAKYTYWATATCQRNLVPIFSG